MVIESVEKIGSSGRHLFTGLTERAVRYPKAQSRVTGSIGVPGGVPNVSGEKRVTNCPISKGGAKRYIEKRGGKKKRWDSQG